MLLYVHVPFCRRKCSYCAFHSTIPKAGQLARYAGLIRQEIEYWSNRLDRPRVESVYFGGGTPSLLQLPLLVPMVQAIEKGFRLDKDVEFTFEGNPESIADWTYLHGLKAVGVNRLSLGVQSLDEKDLARLGRLHTAQQAEVAVRLARQAGFQNISVDLMWGLPEQKLHHWLAQLRQIVNWGVDHLSCYSLTLEPGTPMERMSRDVDMEFADDEEQSKMFLYGADFLEGHGYLQYEISNFARMGYTSRHNQGYWESRSYLGLGPSAVSTIGAHRWSNPADFGVWARDVEAGELGRDTEDLDADIRLRETIMLRLRTTRGLRLRAYRDLTGRSFMEDFGPLLQALRQNELIRISRGYLRLSRTGMLVSDTILANLMDAAPEALPQGSRGTLD